MQLFALPLKLKTEYNCKIIDKIDAQTKNRAICKVAVMYTA